MNRAALAAEKAVPVKEKEFSKSDILDLLDFIHSLSPEARADLETTFVRNEYEPGKHLLIAGNVCDRMHFIAKGLVHCYNKVLNPHTKEYEKETDYFMMEGQIAISKRSYYYQEPSVQYIEALERTVTYSICYKELENIYLKHIEFNITGRKFTEIYHCESNLKTELLRIKDYYDRYLALKTHKPNLLDRAPNNLLARMMGMTNETLSRCRRRDNNPKKRTPKRPNSSN